MEDFDWDVWDAHFDSQQDDQFINQLKQHYVDPQPLRPATAQQDGSMFNHPGQPQEPRQPWQAAAQEYYFETFDNLQQPLKAAAQEEYPTFDHLVQKNQDLQPRSLSAFQQENLQVTEPNHQNLLPQWPAAALGSRRLLPDLSPTPPFIKEAMEIANDQSNHRISPIPGYTAKVKIGQKYDIVGFISSGTYGKVYKAVTKNAVKVHLPTTIPANSQRELFAIKKFKPEKEGDNIQYTGLSQSAIREMSLCTELSHPNLIHLVEMILEDKCVFMVFEYCEHDLLQIIHHHTQPTRHPIPATMIRSILFQLLNGLLYLHRNWVMHRDLKPANIMVTSAGAVRIGDLGLARLFNNPLASLYTGDKVVVTIWYRSPDLLLGARHYTPATDLWAVGCIFAELLNLRPIFKGEETKMDSKKTVPFQRNQMGKIVEILGMPRREDWKGLVDMPEYNQLQSLILGRGGMYPTPPSTNKSNGRHTGLETWYGNCLRSSNYAPDKSPGPKGYELLRALLEYDPEKRLTAEQALEHEYFRCQDGGPNQGKIWVSGNCFEGLDSVYAARRVSNEVNDIGTGSLPGTKRSGLPDDSLVPGSKRRV